MHSSSRDFLKSQSIVKRRRKRRTLRLIFNLVILLIIFIAVSWLSWLSQLAIRNVVVVGNSSVQATELQTKINSILDKKYFGIASKRNALIYPKQEISEFILKEYPRIAGVKIDTDGMHILNVVVEERKPMAIWCAAVDCFYIDETSYIYDPANASSTESSIGAELITLHGNDDIVGPKPLTKTVFTKDLFEGMMASAKAIQTQSGTISMVVTDIYFKKGESIVFKLKNNGRIIFSDKRPFEESLANLKSALSSSIFSKAKQFEYIDVRFSNKVFYRLKGGVEATSTSSV